MATNRMNRSLATYNNDLLVNTSVINTLDITVGIVRVEIEPEHETELGEFEDVAWGKIFMSVEQAVELISALDEAVREIEDARG